jgi:hypothetical protein
MCNTVVAQQIRCAPTAVPTPPAPTTATSLLEKLLAMPLPAPAPPAAPDLRDVAMARIDAAGAPVLDLRALALGQMSKAGQLTPGETMTLPPPEEESVGLFGGIEKSGPRPRKPRGPVVTVKPDSPKGISTNELLASLGVDPMAFAKNSRFAEARRRAGVVESVEFSRIKALPRRVLDLSHYPDLTDKYKKPEGTMRLWSIQSAALHDAEIADGLLAPVGVGWGKSLISLLLPIAMHSKKAVLLVAPQLKRKCLEDDIPSLYRHWQIPTASLRVISYSELSNAKCAQLLDEINPDLVIADECHNLRHKSAARTKRFLRFMKNHPNCRFAGLSGTITRRSILDYQHLMELALRKNSPVPDHYGVLLEWSEALDVSEDPASPGALLGFCTVEEIQAVNGKTVIEAQPFVRSGFRRRLVETEGVVSTEEGAIGTSLVISGLRPLLPAEVKIAIDDLRKKWEIDGDELIDAMSVARIARELAAGFFYRWVWPGGVKDLEWLGARSAWNKELRSILQLNRRGLDSPLEVVNAIRGGHLRSDTWEAWAAVKGRPEPPREAVWLSDYLIDEAIRWGRETCSKTEPGIIWYMWDAFGQRVALKGGFPWYGPGMKNDPGLARPDQEPVIVCSLQAHGTGKNLQRYCRNIMSTPPTGGVEWEQTMARTHRPGQEADEVTVDVFLHTQEMQKAWDQATRDANYIQETQGQKQKLLYAKKLDCEFVPGMECY